EIRQDEYAFHPGQALFCMTEGFYSPRGRPDCRPQPRWFFERVADALGRKRQKPLVNAVFDALNKTGDAGVGPDDSLLALSVEFAGGKRRGARAKND
ncbi:MAG: hypothetical protein LBS30_06460, partial [Planctomycetota bacterium]|nr:hypothetical protein [Planctomycetota bacterium]